MSAPSSSIRKMTFFSFSTDQIPRRYFEKPRRTSCACVTTTTRVSSSIGYLPSSTSPGPMSKTLTTAGPTSNSSMICFAFRIEEVATTTNRSSRRSSVATCEYAYDLPVPVGAISTAAGPLQSARKHRARSESPSGSSATVSDGASATCSQVRTSRANLTGPGTPATPRIRPS